MSCPKKVKRSQHTELKSQNADKESPQKTQKKEEEEHTTRQSLFQRLRKRRLEEQSILLLAEKGAETKIRDLTRKPAPFGPIISVGRPENIGSGQAFKTARDTVESLILGSSLVKSNEALTLGSWKRKGPEKIGSRIREKAADFVERTLHLGDNSSHLPLIPSRPKKLMRSYR
uniref:Uncharacterized protein n=1 Tax=Ananas comosus var. bracteatus TaxID=296719 RepID=A0A6V7QST1_ANACO